MTSTMKKDRRKSRRLKKWKITTIHAFISLIVVCSRQVISGSDDKYQQQLSYRYFGFVFCQAFSHPETIVVPLGLGGWEQRHYSDRRITSIDSTPLMWWDASLPPSKGYSSSRQYRRRPLSALRNQHTTTSHHQSIPAAKPITPPVTSTENTDSLEAETADILSTKRIPLGALTQDDIETIYLLMVRHTKSQTKHSALQVEQLLRRIVIDRDAGNPIAQVTTRMYTMAIDAWAKTGGPGAAERADMIHLGMVELFERTGDKNIRPSTISYNAVINAWSKSTSHRSAPRAEEILEEMLRLWELRPSDDDDDEQEDGYDVDDGHNYRCSGNTVKPDVVSFTSVIDAWAKSGCDDAPERALTLLKRMEKLYKERGQKSMKPNVYTYSACINAFARSNDGANAEKLLEDIKESYETGNSDVKPNVFNYNSVINAYGRSSAPGSAANAARFLDVMAADGIEPDALTYSLIVSAWVHSDERDAIQQAERYLVMMEEWATEKNNEIDRAFNEVVEVGVVGDGEKSTQQAPSSLPAIRVHLDVECYNMVLITLSRSQLPDAPKRAETILRRMEQLANMGFETARPNAKSWNAVLNTVSRALNSNAVVMAEEIMNEMDKGNIQPDIYSYASILHAYQKNTVTGGAERAHDILRHMEQLYIDGDLADAPDVFHYTIVCSCWARSGSINAAEKCSRILQQMQEQYESGQAKCKPNVRTYNAVIDAHARCQDPIGAERLLDSMLEKYRAGDYGLKPDSFTFNAVINAWIRSKCKGCGERAEKVLEKLLRFRAKDDFSVGPDTRSFSKIIEYYSLGREHDAAERAEWLLIGMIKMFNEGNTDVHPNMFCCVSVINSFVKWGDANAGLCAERILNYIKDLQRNHNETKLAPNTLIMNSVLHAWLKSGDPMAGERAEKHLLYMESQYQDGKFELQPNTRTYGLVLASWAKSENPDKTRNACNILKLMEKASKTNSDIQMNIHCYNAVMNAAAFTEGGLDKRIDAFYVASMILDYLVNNDEIRPVSSSFGTFLKACGKLSLSQELVEPCMENAWDNCKRLGLVDEFVLTQMYLSTSQEQYQRLMGELSHIKKNVNLSDIPNEWKRKILDRTLNEGRGEWYT